MRGLNGRSLPMRGPGAGVQRTSGNLRYPSLDSAIHLGVIGDSGLDEYRADDNRGGDYAEVTFNPLEMMVRILGIDWVNPGPWGTRETPRRTGYEYNWSLSGATAGSVHNGTPGDSIVNPDQITGLAAQVSAGQVDTVIIWAGANDFALWNGTFDQLYYNNLTPEQVGDKIGSILENFTTAVDAVLAAGAARVLVTNLIDLTVDPGLQAVRTNAEGRQRVSDAIATVNTGIASLVSAREKCALIDRLNWTTTFITEYADQIDLGTGVFTIEGEDIYPTAGDDPHNFLLGDAEHYGTVYSGILANLHIIDVLNNEFGLSIPRLTDAEIIGQLADVLV